MMGARRLGPTVTLAALIGSFPGCSFVFVTRAPPPSERPRVVDCTTSNVAPIADTVIAVSQVVGFMYAFDASNLDYQYGRVSPVTGMVFTAALFALFAASAARGYTATGECKEIMRQRGVPTTNPTWPERERRQQEEADEEAAVQAAAKARAAEQAAASGRAPPQNTATPAPPPVTNR